MKQYLIDSSVENYHHRRSVTHSIIYAQPPANPRMIARIITTMKIPSTPCTTIAIQLLRKRLAAR
jgi:hypothetical protein